MTKDSSRDNFCSAKKCPASPALTRFSITMRKVIINGLLFGTVVLTASCLTRPIDPEKSGLYPYETASAELSSRALKAFSSILGAPLPASFKLRAPVTGALDNQNILRQIRVEAEIDEEDFDKAFQASGWKQIAAPDEELESMHLSRAAAKELVKCYLGKVHNKPAYLFWFPSMKSLALFMDV